MFLRLSTVTADRKQLIVNLLSLSIRVITLHNGCERISIPLAEFYESLVLAARIKLPGEIWIVSRIEFRIHDVCQSLSTSFRSTSTDGVTD